MNSTKLNKTLKGFALAFAMAFGLILMTGVDANAQNRGRDNDRYDNDRDDQDNNRGYQDNERYNGRDRNGNQSIRYAYQKGYQRGVQQGMRDARSRRGGNSGYGNNNGYGYNQNNGYGYNQNNGYGYNQNNGNNGRIQQAFQSGFQRGYREGLNRGRNNGRNNGYFSF